MLSLVRWVSVALPVVALVILCGLVLGSSSFQNCKNEAYARYENAQKEEKHFPDLIVSFSGCFIEKTHDSVTAIATLVIAFFTIILAIVGAYQISDARILQRAYVGVKPLGIHFWDDDPIKVVGHLAYINVGNLPAINLKNAVKIKWHHDRELDVFDPVKVLSPGIMLLPKIDTERGTEILPAEDAKHLAKKEGYIYVYGRLEYDDGFGRNR